MSTRVRVAHGDIRFARTPVLVGHYSGDGILSAEAALDHALDGRLSRCARLGLYPGPIETCQVFVDQEAWAGPPGAVVLGLGEVGHLTVGQLTRAVAHAVLTFAGMREVLGGQTPAAAETSPRPLSVSTLLIGSGAGGLGVAESVQGMLDGVRRANDRLRAAGFDVHVEAVEILEIWQDRALLAVRALQDALTATVMAAAFVAEPELRVVRGGRRRPMFSEPPGWWQRVHIDAQADGALAFESPTQRAGTAVRTVAAQRLLVDRLVTSLVDTPTPDQSSARTLFELLIPTELKDQAPTLEDVVLVLDKGSAQYPWELLQGAWTGADGRPVALERGVIRQLTSDTFRSRVLAATGKQALVIGDTDSGGPPLPGAQREAKDVETALAAEGFECTTLVRGRGTQIVRELFARPYRVIHIAAHGVRDHPVSPATSSTPASTPASTTSEGTEHRVTGVVLGDGMYLTATEVAQMSQAPDLVFVNCCHLGATGQKAADKERAGRSDYHRLAASFAAELIDAGVRAVVVAGWAVDDAAASTFATTLYRGLLGGLTFGVAVTAARVETWTEHPEVNTWGAYQCYADPDFRLSHRSSGERTRMPWRPPACVEEVETAIDNITQAMTVARSTDDALAELTEYCSQLEGSEWPSHPRVRVRLARAYTEAGELRTALEEYERAARDGSAALTLRDVEAGAELRVRLAAEQVLAGEVSGVDAAKQIDAAITTLSALLTDPGLISAGSGEPPDLDALVDAPGADLERLWRLGLAYQRRAYVATDGREQALRAMAACFRAALAVPASPADRPRSGLAAQVLRAELALGWMSTADGVAADGVAADGVAADGVPADGVAIEALDLPALLERALADALAIAKRSPTFWRRVVCVDLRTLAELRRREVATDVVQGLAGDYHQAARSGSARELALLDESIEFLVEMAKPVSAASAFLIALRDGLRDGS